MTQKKKERKYTLYDSRFEHDACGIGAVVNINGTQTHETVDDALSIVEKLEHRAGKDAAGETGDGVGILTQIPHSFFAKDAAARKISLGEAGDYGERLLCAMASAELEQKLSASVYKLSECQYQRYSEL